jgi:hypothetical protein
VRASQNQEIKSKGRADPGTTFSKQSETPPYDRHEMKDICHPGWMRDNFLLLCQVAFLRASSVLILHEISDMSDKVGYDLSFLLISDISSLILV